MHGVVQIHPLCCCIVSPWPSHMLARATKLLRDLIGVEMVGQHAIFAAFEEPVCQSWSLIFFQRLFLCPSSASSNGHGNQSTRRQFTGGFIFRVLGACLGAAVDTCLVLNRENSGFGCLAGRPRKRRKNRSYEYSYKNLHCVRCMFKCAYIPGQSGIFFCVSSHLFSTQQQRYYLLFVVW